MASAIQSAPTFEYKEMSTHSIIHAYSVFSTLPILYLSNCKSHELSVLSFCRQRISAAVMLWILPIIAAFAAHSTALVPSASRTGLPSNPPGLPPTGSPKVTAHDSFSSSIGVHGCKVDVNRIAYWPFAPDCSRMCIKLKFGSRSRTVLHIDKSGGAYDISFDTFQYLAFGTSATAEPVFAVSAGHVTMDYEIVDMSECADIITSDTGKMSFIASSPNQINECLRQGNNWVAQNYELRNINDSQCQNGVDEVCTLETATGNPKCPSQVGIQSELSPAQPVIDFTPPCGDKKIAGHAPPVPGNCATVVKDPST